MKLKPLGMKTHVIVGAVLFVLFGAVMAATFGLVKGNADYICTQIINSSGECSNGSWGAWTTVSTTTDASGNTIQRQQRTYTGQRILRTVIEYLNLRTQCDPGFTQQQFGNSGGASGYHGGQTYTQYQVCQIIEGQTITSRPTCTGQNCTTPPTTTITVDDPSTRQTVDGDIVNGGSEQFTSMDDVNNAVLRAQEQNLLSQTTFKVLPALVQQNNKTRVFWDSVGATSCDITSNTNADHWTNLDSPADGVESGAIPAETTYKLVCRSQHGASVTRTALVKIVPIFQEH
jgi:hypothetical protein